MYGPKIKDSEIDSKDLRFPSFFGELIKDCRGPPENPRHSLSLFGILSKWC